MVDGRVVTLARSGKGADENRMHFVLTRNLRGGALIARR
jgi:hypothetical protein